MSTRSCIARPTDMGWKGRYHHSDGYPVGLGKFLFEAYHAQFSGDLEAMTKLLIDDHPAGWSNVVDTTLTRTDIGYDETFWESRSPDWDRPRCFCHGARCEDPHEIVCHCPVMADGEECDGCDPLYIEWAYILTPQGLEVWDHHPVRETEIQPLENVPGYRREVFRHRRLGLVPWDAPGMDFEAFEQEHERLYEEEENPVMEIRLGDTA